MVLGVGRRGELGTVEARVRMVYCRRRALQHVSEGEHQVTKGGTMRRIPVMQGCSCKASTERRSPAVWTDFVIAA